MESFDIQYGNESVRCHVTRSPRRRTLGIDVFPDRTVRVKAPAHVDMEVIRARVQRRARWIARKRAEFAGFGLTTRTQPLQSGANVQLLGRHYRLKVEYGAIPGVMVSRTVLRLMAPESWASGRITAFLKEWERLQAANAFASVANAAGARLARYRLAEPRLVIKRMRTRWASMSRKGTLSVNPILVRAPRSCIEYVITHELCHLVHPNHGTAFVRLLGRVMPDWRERKQQLEHFVES